MTQQAGLVDPSLVIGWHRPQASLGVTGQAVILSLDPMWNV
jgi:hypothetical protein